MALEADLREDIQEIRANPLLWEQDRMLRVANTAACYLGIGFEVFFDTEIGVTDDATVVPNGQISYKAYDLIKLYFAYDICIDGLATGTSSSTTTGAGASDTIEIKDDNNTFKRSAGSTGGGTFSSNSGANAQACNLLCQKFEAKAELYATVKNQSLKSVAPAYCFPDTDFNR